MRSSGFEVFKSRLNQKVEKTLELRIVSNHVMAEAIILCEAFFHSRNSDERLRRIKSIIDDQAKVQLQLSSLEEKLKQKLS
jgi:hypothetical protein